MGDGDPTWIANFIWSIADDVLRDVYVRGKYRDVILPMTVIRRLDAVFEPSKEAVLKMKDRLDVSGVVDQHLALCKAAGEAFYNTSKFALRDLKSRTNRQQLKADFEAYLDGFSPNVQEILEKFGLHNQIPKLVEADILGSLIEKFLDSSVNLSPKPVVEGKGGRKLEALDNHGMGTLFEELIRRFNEENNEEAGEHFTPRDVVKLMADLVFLPIANRIESGTYLVYDGACGTGGMLTVAEERLTELARAHGKETSIHLYGQEVNPETYAITKADLLLKGDGAEAENMRYGSTLSADGFTTQEFDFMLSNPPYGKSWKTDLDRMGGRDSIRDPRFVIAFAGDPEFDLIPRSSDGQLLFLVNMLSKMKRDSPLGSRIAEVHNGSSLFTGDAGQGESNIRRWIIENDWLEAIIALPLNMFYNTGIATYIWVLTNRKDQRRKGKVQLIDATAWYQPLRKNLGKKNCELSENDRRRISEVFMRFEETEQSKIFPNEAFGFWKVIVNRPLRLKINLEDPNRTDFRRMCEETGEPRLADLIDHLAVTLGQGPHQDFNAFWLSLEMLAKQEGYRLNSRHRTLIRNSLAEKDEKAEPVLSKIHELGKVKEDPLHGRYALVLHGKACVVEYEPDTELRDTEQIPLLEGGGIATFVAREVLPYWPDAWVDESGTSIGYEISFNRYFYKMPRSRDPHEIRSQMQALEKETEGLLGQILVKKGGANEV